jgi:hypothetical protein
MFRGLYREQSSGEEPTETGRKGRRRERYTLDPLY